MKKLTFILSLAAAFCILVINIYGLFLLKSRPGLPQHININKVVLIDKIKIKDKEDIKFVLSGKSIGKKVRILYEKDGRMENENIVLIPFYSKAPFPYLYFFVGVFSFFMGIWVFWVKRENIQSRIFFWGMLSFASALIINGGFYCLQESFLSYIPGILFKLAYPFAIAVLLHFSLTFFDSLRINKVYFIYFPAIVFSLLFEFFFIYSTQSSSIEAYRTFQRVFYFFRFCILIFSLASFLCLVSAYRRSFLEEHRSQIKWIFYGLAVGLIPFLFLYQVPRILSLTPIISEDLSSAFFVFIPITFAFAIIRFKLMDIEFIINRSLVYSFLTVFTISIYLFTTRMLHNLFSSFVAGKELIYSVLAAVVAATVFHPARQKIQRFVDKSFYRQMYDYRKAVSEFGKKSEECLVPEDLAGFLLEEIERILPADYLGIYLSVKSLKKRKLILEKGNSKDLDSLASEIVSGNAVFSRIDSVRTHEKIDFSKEELLEEMNLCLVIPFSFQLTAGKGFLTVGEKKSGERFTGDDIELLLALSRELALNLERLSLQVEIIREKAEKEKLDELSRQKSEFISILSHELRTPMSSIQCLSEMLQRGKISSDRKRMELITLMAGECERLSRFLHNILDFGKIERRSKTYNLERTKLQPVIQEATALFGEAGKENGIFINLHMGKKPVYAEVDRDALMQALINLIDNAMKYSLGKKEVDITLVERKTQIEIQVRDRGMGINEEDRKKIFQSFYRTREGELSNPHGVGLGLKIVRHIMEAHKGKISMAGAPEKGSIFSLIFPKP